MIFILCIWFSMCENESQKHVLFCWIYHYPPFQAPLWHIINQCLQIGLSVVLRTLSSAYNEMHIPKFTPNNRTLSGVLKTWEILPGVSMMLFWECNIRHSRRNVLIAFLHHFDHFWNIFALWSDICETCNSSAIFVTPAGDMCDICGDLCGW